MICKTCKFYEINVTLTEQQKTEVGACRRYPPIPLVMVAQHPISQQMMQTVSNQFPLVTPETWCGEYVLTENIDSGLSKLMSLRPGGSNG